MTKIELSALGPYAGREGSPWHPPEHAIVLTCDEKSQIQALERT